jgi:hypothetical protein
MSSPKPICAASVVGSHGFRPTYCSLFVICTLGFGYCKNPPAFAGGFLSWCRGSDISPVRPAHAGLTFTRWLPPPRELPRRRGREGFPFSNPSRSILTLIGIPHTTTRIYGSSDDVACQPKPPAYAGGRRLVPRVRIELTTPGSSGKKSGPGS